jgi:hypothetical protein
LSVNTHAAQIVATAVADGRLEMLITPDVSYELDGASTERRIILDNTLARIEVRLVPTRLPRLGMTAVVGMMRLARDEDVDLHDRLAALPGVKGFDPTHVINAVNEGCDVLVTADKRLRRKQADIQVLTTSTLRLVSPDQWLLELTVPPMA